MEDHIYIEMSVCERPLGRSMAFNIFSNAKTPTGVTTHVRDHYYHTIIVFAIRSVIATIMNIIIFTTIVTILPSMTMTMTSSGCWWWWWCPWWRWSCFLAGLWIHSVLNKHEIRQDKYLSQCALQQLLTGSGRLWLVGFVQIEASQLHRDFRSILGADGKLSLLTCDAENSQP